MSQSVDLDHPRALDFLREDAAHVNAFFRRAGVATLTTRELFDFAVDPTITPGNIDAAVDALMAVAAARPAVRDAEDEVAERVGVSPERVFQGFVPTCFVMGARPCAPPRSRQSRWAASAERYLGFRSHLLCLGRAAVRDAEDEPPTRKAGSPRMSLWVWVTKLLLIIRASMQMCRFVGAHRLVGCHGCWCCAPLAQCTAGDHCARCNICVSLTPCWLIAVQIFHQAYIPRRLEEVDDYEGDYERLEGGNAADAEGIYYQTLAGMRPDMSGAAARPAIVEASAALPGARQSGNGATPDQASSSDASDAEDEPGACRGRDGAAPDQASSSNASDADDEQCAPRGLRQLPGVPYAELDERDAASTGPRLHDRGADLGEDRGGSGEPAALVRDKVEGGNVEGVRDGSSDSVEESDSEDDRSAAGSTGRPAQAEDGAAVAGWEERGRPDTEAERAARKEHKAAVKEANRERRKTKLKKHVKKRAVNKHKR